MTQAEIQSRVNALAAHRDKLKEHFSGYGPELFAFLSNALQVTLSYSAITHHAINGYSATLTSEEMVMEMLGAKPAPLKMVMDKMEEHLWKLNVRTLMTIANECALPKQLREDTLRDVMLCFHQMDEGGVFPELTAEAVEAAKQGLFAEYLAVPTLQ